MESKQLYTYFYSVPDCNGFILTLTKKLTRDQFIKETGIDPVTNKCIHNNYVYIHLLNIKECIKLYTLFFINTA